MGTKIEMVALAKPLFNFFRTKAISLAATAAKKSLKKANLNPALLDLLVYTGIYRDEHLVEPAIASLIQKKIGANPISQDGKATFSFDLNNGGCGLVSGMQLVDGFIRSGKIRQGMIVTGDAEPFHNLSNSFNFASAAAAIILSATNNGSGFTRFKTDTFLQYKDAFESHVSWESWKKKGAMRNVLLINKKENYLDWCVQCTMLSLKNFLKEAKLHLTDIDLILPSQSPGGLISKLKSAIDIADRVVEIDSSGGEIHTAGPAIALEKVWNNGRFKQSRNILFLTVGSGITTGLALYENHFTS
jgi:3-oxoacyl-[acyl-carrier-protein] synthase-3